ncbi:hypothetical protein, partial [Acinetobacter sp. GN11]
IRRILIAIDEYTHLMNLTHSMYIGVLRLTESNVIAEQFVVVWLGISVSANRIFLATQTFVD